MKYTFVNNRGFSTLMALGTIGILLILVTGLASTYIRENKLSRTSYDEVLAYANAEGMFEYAMLKVRNHREGFQDTVTNSEIDGKILVPTTDRSKGIKSGYEISANSRNESFLFASGTHLIIPLFSSTGSYISGFSKNPNPELGVQKVTGLEISGLSLSPKNLSWTIVAMSGSESIGLTGSGDINLTEEGIIRHKTIQCYAGTERPIYETGSEIPCSMFNASLGDEELEYFYDQDKVLVSDFVSSNNDPYLMVFNDTTISQNIHIRSIAPFTLPTLMIRSEAQKNDSVQVFEFTEDKSRYYDALKYGVYNAD